jgi:hypothetical protein
MNFQYLQLHAPGPWPTVDPRDTATPPNFDQTQYKNQTDDDDEDSHVVVIQL